MRMPLFDDHVDLRGEDVLVEREVAVVAVVFGRQGKIDDAPDVGRTM